MRSAGLQQYSRSRCALAELLQQDIGWLAYTQHAMWLNWTCSWLDLHLRVSYGDREVTSARAVRDALSLIELIQMTNNHAHSRLPSNIQL